jgi:hypothetical protein
MLQLLDKLDCKYKRIQILGRWERKKDPEILALTATISSLKAELSSFKHNYAQLAKTTSDIKPPPTNNPNLRLEKLPQRQPGTPEIVEFKGFTWKWCDKCFNGSWNRTHITAEHQVGIGKRNRRRTTPQNATNPQANLAQGSPTDSPPIPAANSEPTTDHSSTSDLHSNMASTTSSMDFM